MYTETARAFASTKRFVIERELGHGGMGVVYQVHDVEQNTRVALKALTRRDAVNIYRLKNEFRQLADLSHPNLVTLHELCNEGNSWFFTMELVQGQSFDEYVSRDYPSTPALNPRSTPATQRSKIETAAGRLIRHASITLSQRAIGSEFPLPRATCDLKRLRHALRQLVEAVAALHEAGKLHRDIKPSNVLVTAEGRVVVLDFGLVSNSTFVDPAAEDAERTVGGCMFGTPAYMSPEQAAGEAITMASDWYAVGTMMYEALTGQLPFDGSVLEILRQKEETEPVPPSDLVKDVPDDLDQLCRDLLRRDPSRRPTGAEILRYLTGHSAPTPVFDAQSSTKIRKQGELFVGRGQHLETLRAAFEQSKTGLPVTVLVHGLSGMGKSALVRCFANELIRNDEAVVLRGRCYERETVPYKAFDNIIDALSRYMMQLPAEQAAELLPRNVHALAVLFPVLKRVKSISQARRPKHQTADARELRNQAFAALKDLLLRITDFHPLVINIDDLQWADMDSARLLGFLMGPPDPPPLLLVGTYRRDEAENSAFLRHIMSERSLGEGAAEVHELPVDALGEDEARQLAGALLRDLPGANGLLSSAIAAEADGVPFFIAELVQHLKARSEGGDLPVSMQPISLDQVILERVAGMPEDAQRLLHVLCVAAGPLEQGVAIEAAALPAGDRAATLALRAARLVRTRGTRQTDTVETYHDRVRETVVRNLRADVVRQTHARIAAAMERHDVTDPERLVEHYHGAGDGGRAGESAVEAAHAAAEKLAFNRAAQLFRQAILLLSQDDASARELYRHLGDALANAGRGAQAAEAYLKAAEGLQGAAARTLQRMAAQQYLRSGRIQEGTELARRLFREVGLIFPETFSRTILSYGWNKASLRLSGYRHHDGPDTPPTAITIERLATIDATFREVGFIDLTRGAALQVQFLRYAQRARDSQRVMHGLAWQAWSAAMTNRSPKPALRILSEVEDLARRVGTPYAAATAKSARAGCALFLRRLSEVVGPATEAEQIFREHCAGTHWEQSAAATYRYAAIEQIGGFKTILQEAPARARDAMDKDDRYGTAFLTLFVTFSHLVLDQPEEAMRFLDEERARLSGSYGAFHLWVAIRTVHALLYSGDGPAALLFIESETQRFKASACSRGRFYATTMRSLMARCCLAAAKSDRHARPALLRRAERNARAILGLSQPHAEALGTLLLAEAAWKNHDDERARTLLTSCMTGVDRHQAPMFSTYAEHSLGHLLGGTEGNQMVERARGLLEREGIRAPQRWTRIWIDMNRE